jgi:hypothetical protein
VRRRRRADVLLAAQEEILQIDEEGRVLAHRLSPRGPVRQPLASWRLYDARRALPAPRHYEKRLTGSYSL